MKNLFLCGHTGCANRGCEAIVKSTAQLFKDAGFCEKPFLATFKPSQDTRANIEEIAELVPYGDYQSKLQRGICAIRRKLTDPLAGQNIIQKALWSKIQKGDLSLVIGGDTYCYGTPTVHIAHNSKMKKEGNPTVLWCCSVEKSALSGETLWDIKNYDLIVARESETYQNLLQAGVEKDKLLFSCDPAFNLKAGETALPVGFCEGNTVGINLSPMVMNPKVQEACHHLIESILDTTDMTVCFIPHVYSTNPNTQDMKILTDFYEKYKDTGRVCIVDKDLTCNELKYIIGKTRFFIGARTHSTIAAYSSKVPTLVLGYSVKSIGIAKDLFGSHEGFVIPYDTIDQKDTVTRAFEEIVKKEDEIRKRLDTTLTDYIASSKEVTNKIFKRYLTD
ncbi:MAG: polysaccharide pyruvyl transferase family protein [Eubacteriales bacterium]|nr:polysaccharide pyruvyl transferase family protein [Eubacteriales bacterium]